MARGINKVILIGHVGGDPEVRHLPSGGAVTSFTLATTEGWKDKQTGEKQERTEWHRIVCFNRLGEITAEYVRKGSKLYLEGSLRTRKWQDAQGQDRYTTEIVASEMQMLDSKGGSSSSNYNYDERMASAPAPTPAPAQYSSEKKNNPSQDKANASAEAAFDELEDDVPF